MFVHTGPAEWWQVLAALGPLAVLLGAALAALIGWNTLRQRTAADARALTQKSEADNRSEWWKRTQWALDAVLSGDKKRGTVGLKVLGVLGESPLAGPGELAVLEAAWKKPLADAEQKLVARQRQDDESSHSSAESAQGELVRTVSVPAPIPNAEGLTGRPGLQGRVDGEPGPGDNGEEGSAGGTEGGTR